MRRATVLTALALAVLGATAVPASAAPEIGRCKLTEGTKEGKRTTYHARYKNKACTKESAGGNTGRYEWTAGPGESAEVETIGSSAPVTLETTSGRVIACTNHLSLGKITGANTETWKLSLRNCEDQALHKPCQGLIEETTLEETGRIDSLELSGELGYISKAGKPTIGWDLKPKTGPNLFVFECGTTPGLGTKVTVEGSYIEQLKPANKMAEEYKGFVKAKEGKQSPESFEGGAKDTLSATLVTGLESETQQIGLNMPKFEEIELAEELEIRA